MDQSTNTPYYNMTNYRPIPFGPTNVPQAEYDPAQVSSLLNQVGFTNDMQGDMYSQEPVRTDNGNFITNNLATGLSVLGGVAGGILGGPVGAIAGSTIGAGLGKTGENLLEEGKVNVGDVGKTMAFEGITGGLFAGGGKLIGKAGQKFIGPTAKQAAANVSRKAAKQFGKGAAQKAAVEATQDITKAPYVQREGARFLQGAYNNLIDENAARELFIKYGITNPGQSVAIRDLVTGSVDEGPGKALMNNLVENAVRTRGKPFDPTELASMTIKKTGMPVRGETMAEQIINTLPGGAISPETRKDLLEETGAVVEQLLRADRMPLADTPAIEALRAARVFQSKATQTTDRYVAKFYRDFAQELSDKALAPGGRAIAITPAEKQQLLEDLLPRISVVNKQAVKQFQDDINAAETIADIRNLQAKWVTAGGAADQAAREAAQKAGYTKTGLGESLGTPIKSTGRFVGQKLGTVAERTMPKAIQTGTNIARGVGLTDPARMTLLGAMAAPATAGAIYNYQQPVLAQGEGLMTPEGMAGLGAGGGASALGQGMGAGPQGQPAISELQKAYMGAALFNPTLMGAMTMTPEQRQASAGAVQALQAVNTFEKALRSAGGGQGPIGGTITKLKGVGGGSARTYEQKRREASRAIGQALGQDPAIVLEDLPSVTDTADQAQAKIETLKQQLRVALQASQQTGLSGLGFSGNTGTPSLLSGLMR